MQEGKASSESMLFLIKEKERRLLGEGCTYLCGGSTLGKVSTCVQFKTHPFVHVWLRS